MPRVKKPRTVTLAFLDLKGEGDLREGCPHCGAGLDFLQPDAKAPDRLLGVCGGCAAWVVAVLAPGAAPGG